MKGGAEPHHPNTIDNDCEDGSSGTFHVDESIDRLLVTAASGNLTHGASATITVTVWAGRIYTSDYLDLFYAINPAQPKWVLIKTLRPTKTGAQTLSATYTIPKQGGAQAAVRAQFRYLGSAAFSACVIGGYNDRDDLVFAVQ